jgi:hypothetical protein
LGTVTKRGEAIGTLQQVICALPGSGRAAVSWIQDEVSGTLLLKPGAGPQRHRPSGLLAWAGELRETIAERKH